MDLRKMIAELQAEKQRLDEAIVALERLSAGKIRGRSKHDELSSSSMDSESAEENLIEAPEDNLVSTIPN